MGRPPGTSYRLRASQETAVFLKTLHPGIKRKIKAALKIITTDPSAGKPLKEELKGLSSYRVGRLRIIYRVARRRTIELVAVGPRAIIYEQTYRLVSSERKNGPGR